MSRSRLSGRNDPAEGRRAYIGLGGNLGDPAVAMAAALKALDASAHTNVTAVSSLYRTPPWGKPDQPDFLNAAAAVETGLSARELLAFCLDVERKLKRVRTERWGPRTIDLDLLWFGGQAIAEEGLTVPHPRMAERAFVLVPLAEIAPGLMVDGRTVAARAATLDSTGIEKLTGSQDWWRKP